MSAYTVAVLADSPNLYLRFNDTSGSTCVATVGNNGTYANNSGSFTLSQTGALTAGGDTDLAVKFATNAECDGSGGSHNACQDVGDIFTIEYWLKRETIGITEIVFLNDDQPACIESFINSSNQLTLNQYNTAGICSSTTTIVADGVFHHCVITKSGATVKIYIDGVDRTGSVSNQTFSNPVHGWKLFGTSGTSTIDELALYPTALSAARVLAHYNAAQASPPVNTVAPAVTGTTTVGSALSTTNGTWTDDVGSHVFTYQWQRDTAGDLSFSNIASATSSTYTLVSGDSGNKVSCRVTDTDVNGATTASSNAVGLVTTPTSTFSFGGSFAAFELLTKGRL